MRTDSALIIPVREAEPVVGRWRSELDPAAGWGVPAHITVLYPFVDPAEHTTELIDSITRCFGSMRSFTFRLDGPKWFGTDVLYLAPDPQAPFLKLIELATARWPEHPPYGGTHAEVIPHLTVADRADPTRTAAAIDAIEPLLPIAASASEVWLMTGGYSPDSWRTVASCPFVAG